MCARTELYPAIEAYETGMLKVSDIHHVYWEQSGNKNGNPVVLLHGGPGAGTTPMDRTFFDPAIYRIILLDQRGTGKSSPSGELMENTTWDLVADIESLREHLGIDTWVVIGGSWGSTLALLYAETHPERVKALILRGIFSLRRNDLMWFYEEGAGACMLFPDFWEEYVKPIPKVERFDMIGAYHRRLTGSDDAVKLECAKALRRWELATSRLIVDTDNIAIADDNIRSLQFASIESHYCANGGFFETDKYILANIDRIRHIPTTIIQGRYDVVGPMEMAWKLHRAFPEAEFHIIPDAGHSKKESGIYSKLVEVSEKYKDL